ncbi:MAG: head GIN domain-containing protein [Sphingobacteriaceae bacterium]
MIDLKYATSLLCAAIIITGFSSCRMFGCESGSGNQIIEERKVADFSKIQISGAYKLILRQDSIPSVLKITADDNLMKDIQTNVSNGKMEIKMKGNYCNSDPILIYANVRQLTAIEGSGANEISSDGVINTKDFELELSGTNKVTLELNASVLRTKGSGSTEINLSGQAGEHWVELNGSGNLNALNLATGKYHIETSGASHCKINVLNELNVRTSGSGNVKYRGNPKSVNNSQSGSSSVTKIE